MSGPAAQPRISVVITTYNYGRFIGAAIDSVLGQTRPPDEVVVVDDGSTDDTAATVAKYTDRGVRYLYQQNAGAGAARNAGIRATTGDYLAFLDADDRWLPEKLALQLAHFRQYPAAGLVTGSERQVYDDASRPPLVVHRPPVGAANMYRQTLIENIIGNPSLTLIRRACFDKVGLFDAGMRLGQDWDMWIRIAREFPVGVVDAELIRFTRHDSSLTAGKFEARAASNREIARRYIDSIKSPLPRLRLKAAARSMSLYYSAAALADDPARRLSAVAPAFTALLLDPTYESKMKLGVLLRSVFGPGALSLLRRLVPARQ